MGGQPNYRAGRTPSILAGLLFVLLCLLRQVTSAQVISEYTPDSRLYGFSVNVVGFINTTIPSGHSLVSAHLFRQAGQFDPFPTAVPNAIPNLLAAVKTNSIGVTKIRSNGRFGTAYFTPDIGWTETDMSLLPGEGAVVWNPGNAFTNTTVGDVLQGTLTNAVAAGLTLCSSIVPQEGLLTSELEFPASSGDAVFRLNPDGSYRRYDYWATGWHPEEPVIRVAEAFWAYKRAATNWVRRFSAYGFFPTFSSYYIRSFAAGPQVSTNNLHPAIPYLPVMPGRIHVASSRAIQLRVTAVNSVVADYQWRKNGVALTDGLRVIGAQRDILELTDLQPDVDDGIYTVTGTNSAGRVVAHAASLKVVTAATTAPSMDLPIKSGAAVTHTLHVQPGAFYRVQSSADLKNWGDVTNFTSTSHTHLVSLPLATNGVRFFYRLASP